EDISRQSYATEARVVPGSTAWTSARGVRAERARRFSLSAAFRSSRTSPAAAWQERRAAPGSSRAPPTHEHGEGVDERGWRAHAFTDVHRRAARPQPMLRREVEAFIRSRRAAPRSRRAD